MCNAQNLIPNGDFEQYSSCPSYWSQINKAFFWTTPTTNVIGISGTPDYFNQCTSYPDMGVPSNFFGTQQTHSGNAYAGIYAWYGLGADRREYIEVSLTSPLVANSCYHFEMYVNIGDICNYTIDNIGVYFSDTLVSGINNQTVLPFVSQINNVAGNYFDNQNWTLVSSNYTAVGGESFLIIGNFMADTLTDTVVLNTATFSATYCYIDDVSLIQIPPCNVGFAEQNENEEIKVYHNPVINKLNISSNNNKLSEIILYDIASRKIMQKKFINSVTLSTEQLSKGLYLYEVRNKDGSCKKGKVVKD